MIRTRLPYALAQYGSPRTSGEVTEEQDRSPPRTTVNKATLALFLLFDLVGIRLLAAGMNLGALGEHVVGPGFFLNGRLGYARRLRTCRHGIVLCFDIPVFRSVGNAPDIAVIVERGADQKTIIPEGKTVRDASGDAASAGEIADHNRSLQLQGAGAAESTALRTYDEHHASLRKRAHAIETCYAHRDLNPQSRAAPGRFGRMYFHRQAGTGRKNALVTLVIVSDSLPRRTVTKVTARSA